MLIMLFTDVVLLAMIFYMTLFIPQPWADNYNIRNNLKPFIQIEKNIIDNYLMNNQLENIDLTKQYSIYYDKTSWRLLLKDRCWKLEVSPLWVYMWWSQTFGRKYCIEIKKLHPLEFNTVFPKEGLIIKYK